MNAKHPNRNTVRPSSIQLLRAREPTGPELPVEDFRQLEVEELKRDTGVLKERYDALLEHVPVGIVHVAQDKTSFFIKYANHRAESLLGTQLRHRRLARFVDTKAYPAFEGELASVFVDGRPRSGDIELINEKRGPLVCDFEMYRVGGSDEQVGICIVDQTARSQALQSARVAKADVRAVVRNNLVPMVVLAMNGRVVHANDRACELLATVRKSLTGRALSDWIVETGRGAFEDQLRRRTNGPVTVDMVRRGIARRVRVQLVAVHWDEEPCMIAAFEDITDRDRRAAQDEREGRLASLGLLVAGVAHEVNNPLAFIVPNVGEVTAALKGMEPNRVVGGLSAGDAAEILEEAQEGLARITSITRDLKGFYSTNDQLETLSLNEVVVDTLRLADSRLRQCSRVRRDLGVLPPLTANRGRVGQVILNLVINAADAMPDRPKTDNSIVVRTWLEWGVIHLEVADNGRGIPKEHLPNLFDPFFTTRRAGTGLGLAICANIVRDMGGWIEVDSTVGEGTRFLLCFPLAEGDDSPRRVLLVTEEPMMIRGTERQMSRKYALVQACGGFEAIRILQREERIDAVVTARDMREGSGADLYDWVVRYRPALQRRFFFLEEGRSAAVDGSGQVEQSIPSLPRPLTGAQLTRLLESLVH